MKPVHWNISSRNTVTLAPSRLRRQQETWLQKRDILEETAVVWEKQIALDRKVLAVVGVVVIIAIRKKTNNPKIPLLTRMTSTVQHQGHRRKQ